MPSASTGACECGKTRPGILFTTGVPVPALALGGCRQELLRTPEHREATGEAGESTLIFPCLIFLFTYLPPLLGIFFL